MNKSDFVQRFAIRCCPNGHDAIEACVESAEGVWDYLCARGYGPSKRNGQNGATKGTRWPKSDDVWPNGRLIPNDWRAWAFGEGYDAKTVVEQGKTFADYWIAQPGHRGVKLDWEATWRNWMRKQPKPEKGKFAQSHRDIEKRTAEQPADLGKKRHAQEMAAMCRLIGNDEQAAIWDKQAGEL